jgi:acyl carrier protein
MTPDAIKTVILEEIAGVAPDVSTDGLADDEDIRDALDLDSMDMLNLVAALHERLGVDIPEADVPQFLTLEGGIAYLRANLPSD